MLILLLKHRDASAKSDETVVVVDLSDPDHAALREPGGAIKVILPDHGGSVIVTRIDGDTYTAFSTICPHWGCEVDLPDTDHVIRCPCHGSSFDMRGRVISGPAEVDLAPFELEIKPGATAVESATWGQLKRSQTSNSRA